MPTKQRKQNDAASRRIPNGIWREDYRVFYTPKQVLEKRCYSNYEKFLKEQKEPKVEAIKKEVDEKDFLAIATTYQSKENTLIDGVVVVTSKLQPLPRVYGKTTNPKDHLSNLTPIDNKLKELVDFVF